RGGGLGAGTVGSGRLGRLGRTAAGCRPLSPLADPGRNRPTAMLRAAPNPAPTPNLKNSETFAMNQTAASANGSAAWAEALLLSFAQAGYVQAEPAILQPAEPFLDLSGEDIRKSLPHHRPERRGIVFATGPHHSGGARLSRIPARRAAGRVLLSRPGVPLSRRAAKRISAG